MILDAKLQSVIDQIATAVRPERIILFGSRAAGAFRADSDLDLLIVYSGPLSPREVRLQVRRLFRLPSFSMDVFVLSPEEFDRQERISSTVGRTAAREGIVCYGR